MSIFDLPRNGKREKYVLLADHKNVCDVLAKERLLHQKLKREFEDQHTRYLASMNRRDDANVGLKAQLSLAEKKLADAELWVDAANEERDRIDNLRFHAEKATDQVETRMGAQLADAAKQLKDSQSALKRFRSYHKIAAGAAASRLLGIRRLEEALSKNLINFHEYVADDIPNALREMKAAEHEPDIARLLKNSQTTAAARLAAIRRREVILKEAGISFIKYFANAPGCDGSEVGLDLDKARALAAARFQHIRKLEAKLSRGGLPVPQYTSDELTGWEFVSSDWRLRAQDLEVARGELVQQIEDLKDIVANDVISIKELQAMNLEKNRELKARGEQICKLHKEKNATPKKTKPNKVAHFQAQVVKLQKKEERHINEMQKKDVALKARKVEIRDLKKANLAGPNEKVGLAVEKRLQVAIAFHHSSRSFQTLIRWVAPVTAIGIIALAVVKIYG